MKLHLNLTHHADQWVWMELRYTKANYFADGWSRMVFIERGRSNLERKSWFLRWWRHLWRTEAGISARIRRRFREARWPPHQLISSLVYRTLGECAQSSLERFDAVRRACINYELPNEHRKGYESLTGRPPLQRNENEITFHCGQQDITIVVVTMGCTQQVPLCYQTGTTTRIPMSSFDQHCKPRVFPPECRRTAHDALLLGLTKFAVTLDATRWCYERISSV